MSRPSLADPNQLIFIYESAVSFWLGISFMTGFSEFYALDADGIESVVDVLFFHFVLVGLKYAERPALMKSSLRSW